jgi:hypothetical protein
MDGDTAEATDRSYLSATNEITLPHRLGRNTDGQLRVVCYQYGGDSQSGLEPAGSPANWRWVVLEKLSRVKLLEDAWRTAANHSRPGACVIQADIDVEDYPEPDPQKGQ